ncbi:MAG: hypothetical protein Q8R15_04225 [Candidatus Micrarchaeota archaeon]|nr:hypothetical protein [Candidatus Micrarchaeota archaeon]
MKPWPNFHEPGLQPMLRAGRLRNSLEHSQMHEHAVDYARLLNEPFSMHHDLAAQALLKIHDENRKIPVALDALQEAYGQRLAEYRQTKNMALRKFLDRIREELENRKRQIEPAEPNEKGPNPLALIAHGAAKAQFKRTIRTILESIPGGGSKPYGKQLAESRDVTYRAKIYQIAAVMHLRQLTGSGHIISIGGHEGRIQVPAPLVSQAKEFFAKTGYTIVDGKTTPNGIQMDITETEQLLNHLKNYKHE